MHCPDCGKKADAAHSLFILYEYRLDLPIFLCSDCRTIYIDKLTIRQKISEWRKKLYNSEGKNSLLNTK